jgi:hypothetical protein
MCIVSRKNNYIFFHIPKCGGTSISEILPNKEKVRLIEHTHLTYLQAKKVFEENNESYFFDDCKKMAVVRNPMDRAISLYKYIKKHTDHHLHNRLINHSFTQFCYFLKNIGDESITSCFNHLCNDNGIIDGNIKIIKLETINHDLDELSELVGCKINKIPHINKSEFYYEETEESDLLIKDIFKEDYELFYNFLI